MGHFVVSKITNLNEVKLGDQIEESDFSTLTDNGNFVQLKYVEDDEISHGEIAKPGVFSMAKTMSGIKLEKSAFSEDDVLRDFVSTKEVTEKIDKFIEAIPRYKKYGIFPKRGVLLHGPPGCHAKGTEILMFDGSTKKVEDVVVGDLLMGPDSKPREVLKLASGRESMVKIKPVKGEEFIVNINHILHLTPSGSEVLTTTPVNMSVLDYLKQNRNFKERYKLTRTGVEFSQKELPIPAYIMGTWLGDGTSSGPEITSMDSEIVNAWDSYAKTLEGHNLNFKAKAGKANTFTISTGRAAGQKEGRNVFRTFLQDLNVIDNKHIPNIYLTSSKVDRLELLAGLIDTDGSASNEGFEITQKSNKLAEDILFLARSLGFAAYSSKSLKSSQNGTEGEYNRIFISGDLSEVPVRLERKKTKKRTQIKSVLRTGFEVEILGVDNYYGFTLDSDHLYLTKDFTIHHNTGKTTIIAESARKYKDLGKTFILLWHTDKIEAGDVKDFIKHLQYEGVDHMILVAEDIGGIEIDQARIRSESALLSLLDNQEQTFKIPVLILATTNYPENFMGNLTNRPNRFDDKIRVDFPKGESRVKLLEFYDKESLLDEEAKKLIASKDCNEFSPAHIREVIIRSAIYNQAPSQVIKDMVREIKEFKNAFEQKSKNLGLHSDTDW